MPITDSGRRIATPGSNVRGLVARPARRGRVGDGTPAAAAVGPGMPMPAPPPPTTAGGVSMTAGLSPELQGLQGQWQSYYDDLTSNSGRLMDIAGGRIRDAREGGRAALSQSEGFRGVASSNRLADYDAKTTGAQSSAIADIAVGRDALRGSALQTGLGIMRAPLDLSLAERGLGLQAAQFEAGERRDSFDQWLALLQATRQSPYHGGSAPGGAYMTTPY